jgi:hypothetical protein
MNSKAAADSRFPDAARKGQPDPMEVWEPPFERWMRIADTALGNVPPRRPEPTPIEKSSAPKG